MANFRKLFNFWSVRRSNRIRLIRICSLSFKPRILPGRPYLQDARMHCIRIRWFWKKMASHALIWMFWGPMSRRTSVFPWDWARGPAALTKIVRSQPVITSAEREIWKQIWISPCRWCLLIIKSAPVPTIIHLPLAASLKFQEYASTKAALKPNSSHSSKKAEWNMMRSRSIDSSWKDASKNSSLRQLLKWGKLSSNWKKSHFLRMSNWPNMKRISTNWTRRLCSISSRIKNWWRSWKSWRLRVPQQRLIRSSVVIRLPVRRRLSYWMTPNCKYFHSTYCFFWVLILFQMKGS